MNLEVDLGGLEKLPDRMGAAGQQVDVVLSQQVATMRATVAETTVATIKAATRRDTGALEESSHALTFQTDTRGTVDVYQDALSRADLSGNWGGRPYVQWVLHGRGEVTPKLHKWLRWVRGGRVFFAKKVKAWPGDDYVARVQPQLRTATQQIAARGGNAVVARLLEDL